MKKANTAAVDAAIADARVSLDAHCNRMAELVASGRTADAEALITNVVALTSRVTELTVQRDEIICTTFYRTPQQRLSRRG